MGEHPLIEALNLFKEVKDGDLMIMESKYHFRLGPVMSNALQNLPAGSPLRITIRDDGNIHADILSEPCSGWRVKAGSFFLYLVLVKENITAPNVQAQVGKLHNELMARAVYYPEQGDILNYWSHPDDDINRSEDYVYPVERSEYLENLITKHCTGVTSIVELGCNVGRNLNHLHQTLNVKVAGLEISRHALDLMKKEYPSLSKFMFYSGDMTTVIQTVPDKTYDLVFSMAVLMHLYPTTSQQFWSHIVRISNRYIITIENETSGSNRNWPRNYKQILEPLGPREIYSEIVGQVTGLENYVSRVFEL